MKLLEYAWFKDIQTCIEELKELAMGKANRKKSNLRKLYKTYFYKSI